MSASPAGRKALKASGKKPMPIAAAKDFRKLAKKAKRKS
jgi:hypothetical protein